MTVMNGTSTLQDVTVKLIAAYRSGELGESLDATPLLRQFGVAEVDLPLIEQFKRQVDALVRSDAREAIQVAELAKSLSLLSSDEIVRALGARMKAMALHVSSRYAEAFENYQQASQLYRKAGREVEMGRVQRAMVDALIYLGRYDEALQLADEARQVFQKHDEKLLLAQVETNAGNIYHRLDQNQEALACYERAAEVFAAAEDRNGLALASFNRANVYCNLDDFGRAQELYQQAYELHSAEENQFGAVQTRYSIGYLYFLRGAYHQAMRILHETREESLRLGDEQTAALCILDLAEIYLQSNVLDEAARLSSQARELFLSLGMRYEAARSLTFLGLAQMRLLKFDEAQQSFIAALEEFAVEGNQVHFGLVSLYQAELSLLRGQTGEAVKLATEAETIFASQQLKAKTCSAQIVRARALLSGGESAQELCETILQTCRELESPWLRYQAHELLGDNALAAGDVRRAYEQYTQSVSFIEQIRCQIRVDEFRSAFFKDKLRVYEKLIRLCLNEDDPQRQAEAFYYLESSKARTLVDLLINELELMPASDGQPNGYKASELHQRWQTLREQLHWYYSKVSNAEIQTKSRLVGADLRLQTDLLQCERALAEVTRQLQTSDTGFLWLQQSGGMTVQELREILAADEAVIEYYFDGGDVKIFVVDHQAMNIVGSECSVGEINELIQTLRFQFDKFQYGTDYLKIHADRLLQSAKDCLHQLWQALFAPVAELAQGKKLIFIPFGVLHNVPFQALFDGEQYLLENHEITQSPSARILKLCSERTPRNLPHKYERAVIFGAADEIAPQITEEILAIRTQFPDGACFTGATATAEALSANAASGDILHIASHAVFRQDNPMFSAFKLADTWLNFYDICRLKLSASLVTLSGCSTGASRVYAGDELMGLARGFLSAGAASLIVSLWAVNDPAAAKQMTAFYELLRSGNSTRAALRKAALEIKSLQEHPYFWAPFVLISHH